MKIWQLTPWVELDAVIRLVAAAVVAGIIGFERERARKPAGLRTHILVSVGAALFTLASIYGFGNLGDPARIAAGVVVGIGFLGAGTIIHHEATGGVIGLTTSASIWLVAAIGLTMGAGLYLLAAVTGIIGFIVLRLPQ